jgi:hypothetical protein
MSTPARYYSSIAVRTTLASSITSTDTELSVAADTGFPQAFPFTLILEKDSANEEIVTVTGEVGTAYVVVRGVDGTAGRSHAAGTAVEHGVAALDFTDFRAHEAASVDAHGIGVSNAVVGTGTAQTLSNKTLGSNLAAGGNRVTGLADPTNAQDAVTKNWAETGMTSQLNQATAAKTAAEAAQGLAEAAQLAAEQAETNAETAETGAIAAQGLAEAAQLAAENAKDDAETAELGAQAAQGLAETAQLAAEAAETGALSAQGAAEAARDEAQDWAIKTDAPVSGTSFGAKYYSDLAAVEATDAAQAAVDAAQSAAAAAASFEDFDRRYLGAKSSPPALDNEGQALETGALYYDTVEGKMFIYDGAGWLPASAASVQSFVLYEYTATASQTTFSGADDNSVSLVYTVGLTQVFLNGVLLMPGEDYAATDGSSVVLVSGAAASDSLAVAAFGSFSVANTYTIAQADATFATKAELETAGFNAFFLIGA